MLTILETYQDRKDWIWSRIDLYRDLIKTIQDNVADDQPLKKPVIKNCRADIRECLKELEDLARWFKKSGLKPDEQYRRVK